MGYGTQKVRHDYESDALSGGSNQVDLGTCSVLAAFDALAVDALRQRIGDRSCTGR